MCNKLKMRCGVLFYLIVVLVLSCAVKNTFGELSAYYPMNEGSGTVIGDATGLGHDGVTLVEPAWVDGPPGFGYALYFDGTNPAPGWVNCGTWNPSEQTGQLTVTLWLKWEGTNDNWQGVVAKRDGWGSETDVMWYLEMNSGTGAIFFARMGQTGAAADAPPPIGQWQHVAVSFDGTTATLYLDGEEANSGEFSFGPGVEATVMIGADNLGGANGFNGTIDEVRIYDTALTQEEIQAVMMEAGFVREKAMALYPKDKQTEVSRDAVLSWRPGDLAVAHNVYLGTDPNDVNEATVDDPRDVLVSIGQAETTYQPPALLDYDVTYYWRVDEVNDMEPNSPWKSDLWSFTTANYIVLEDFESYGDDPPNEIWNTWIDGFGDDTNGSVAGYPDPDFIGGEHYVETDIVHGGNQAMPLFYDNSDSGFSEATKTLTEMRNWTVDDVITLTLFYYGDAGNSSESMFVGINGTAVVYNQDPRATLNNEWIQWDIPMQEFADLGVDLTNVNSISLGFGNKANPVPGGEGHVFFDDIRLSRSEAIEYEPEIPSVNPGTTNLRLYYAFENDIQDTSGRGYNAAVSGNPTFVPSATGYGTAIALDGEGDFISLPIGQLISTLSECTIATWVNWSGTGGSWQRIFDFGTGEDINMFLTPSAGNIIRFAITTGGSSAEEQTSISGRLPAGWHHLAVTIDPTNTTHILYLDSKVGAQNTAAINTPSSLGVTTQNRIGLSQYEADPLFTGSVDEFRIYNSVLTRPEILYLAGK